MSLFAAQLLNFSMDVDPTSATNASMAAIFNIQYSIFLRHAVADLDHGGATCSLAARQIAATEWAQKNRLVLISTPGAPSPGTCESSPRVVVPGATTLTKGLSTDRPESASKIDARAVLRKSATTTSGTFPARKAQRQDIGIVRGESRTVFRSVRARR